ncbi:MAG TPA: ATP-binding protein [Puia sp.]|jgi:signal transduction histidine kinase
MNNHVAGADRGGKYFLLPSTAVNYSKEIAKIILNTQEKERFEVGKELHDNVCQMLATVKLYLDTGLKDETYLQEFVKLGKDMLMSSMDELRRISKSLAPPSLGSLPLEQSLGDLVYTIHIARKEIYLDIDGLDEEMISHELKISIYRIIQEQLSNILKYAEATRIDIHIHQRDRRLCIQVKDNGRGFDPGQKRAGIGITNMISRVNVFGGKIQIDAAPGKGCVLSVDFCL